MTAHLHITGTAASELKKLAKKNKRSTAQEGQLAIERHIESSKKKTANAEQ